MNVTIQLWDIGGQSIGSKMLKNYIYGANAVVLCYDITSYESFQNLEDWYRLVKETAKGKMEVPHTALLANKVDLSHIRAVKQGLHDAFVDEFDVKSFTTSAKTGDGVDESFYKIAADLSGVVLTKPAVQVSRRVVAAEIIDHQKDDPNIKTLPIAQRKGKCSIQ